jgi:hypothetical protein
MIGHQAIGMHGTLVLLVQLPKLGQIDEAIGFRPEAGNAIDAALNYVYRDAGKD